VTGIQTFSDLLDIAAKDNAGRLARSLMDGSWLILEIPQRLYVLFVSGAKEDAMPLEATVLF
jgi:hypothetical protein